MRLVLCFLRVCSLMFVIFLFGGFSVISRQVNVFSIRKAGIKIGTLTATSTHEGSHVFYSLASNSSMWMGTKVWVNFSLKCVYDRNKLFKADMETHSSKGNYVSWIRWKGDHYEYDVRSYKRTKAGRLPMPVDFSLVKMYFSEPQLTRRHALSENHAEMVKVASMGDHVYNAYVNETPNVYHYRNGKLMKADLSSSSFEYTLERED